MVGNYAQKEGYVEDSWLDYSTQELGQFVHLLLKRASHRKNKEKMQKDIDDARNYFLMLQAHLDKAQLLCNNLT